MSTTTRKLRMKFGNEDGNKDITIDNPLTDLDSETTANAMNDIVALETLVDNKGKLLNLVVGAELETITKDTLF
ncbi:MAG: DUF2922 family protein [Peptococcaceae bacterium]|jgi:hypothetical protein|nr:DUF2922 family protein [Peptococcaceae bacterium]